MATVEQYIYAIPSYNRANKQVTLGYFEKIGVPKEAVCLFVQTEQDYDSYQAYKDRAEIIYMPASRGVEARNNILNRLNDRNILMLDDDVSRISYMKNGKLRAFENHKELADVFNFCFAQSASIGARVFGVYPIANAFFMSNDISTRVAINTIFGIEKGFKIRFDESFDTKEDAEICGRMLSHGMRIARFNNIAVQADHRKDKNGYFDKWHHDENVRSVKQLCARYPHIFVPQKGKPWEVRVTIKDQKIPDAEF